MNHILEVDEATFTATVEPGVLLKDFQAHVEAMGLFYPPEDVYKRQHFARHVVPLYAVDDRVLVGVFLLDFFVVAFNQGQNPVVSGVGLADQGARCV